MVKICIECQLFRNVLLLECAYNHDKVCQARAITVGDGINPGCDTFLEGSQHAMPNMDSAGIGACKITGCKV